MKLHQSYLRGFFTICGLFILLFCCSCGPSHLSEKQILVSLPSEMTTIQVDGETRKLPIKSFEVEKRQTNEKDDTVYCIITAEDDLYQTTWHYCLYYNFYDKGGWILDNYEQYQSMDTQPISVLPIEEVQKYVAQYFTESDYSRYYFDDTESLSSVYYEFEVKNEFPIMMATGNINVNYFFSGTNGVYSWEKSIGYLQMMYDWSKLAGTYVGTLECHDYWGKDLPSAGDGAKVILIIADAGNDSDISTFDCTFQISYSHGGIFEQEIELKNTYTSIGESSSKTDYGNDVSVTFDSNITISGGNPAFRISTAFQINDSFEPDCSYSITLFQYATGWDFYIRADLQKLQ